jgi:hypothetical protein
MHCGSVVAFISREANQALLPGRWTLFLAKAMRNPETKCSVIYGKFIL